MNRGDEGLSMKLGISPVSYTIVELSCDIYRIRKIPRRVLHWSVSTAYFLGGQLIYRHSRHYLRVEDAITMLWIDGLCVITSE